MFNPIFPSVFLKEPNQTDRRQYIGCHTNTLGGGGDTNSGVIVHRNHWALGGEDLLQEFLILRSTPLTRTHCNTCWELEKWLLQEVDNITGITWIEVLNSLDYNLVSETIDRGNFSICHSSNFNLCIVTKWHFVILVTSGQCGNRRTGLWGLFHSFQTQDTNIKEWRQDKSTSFSAWELSLLWLVKAFQQSALWLYANNTHVFKALIGCIDDYGVWLFML